MTTDSANQTVPGRNGTVPQCISTPPTQIQPVKCTEIPCRTVPYPCRGTVGGDRAGVPPPYRGARPARPPQPLHAPKRDPARSPPTVPNPHERSLTMPTTAARAATQLAQLLDQPPAHPTQHLAARLTTLAHLLWTTGHLATTRAHEHAPGIRATNTDPHRTHGGDPTATTAIAGIDDPTATLERDLRQALTDLDQAATRLTVLMAAATTVHRTDPRPTTECAEALCTEAATPGRLGWCEVDYARRYAWARRNRNQQPTRRDLLDAPPLTRQTLADRAIRKQRRPA